MQLQFCELEQRFGEIVAHSLLMEIEKHVKLNSTALACVDPNSRLQVALALMSEPSLPTASAALN